MVLSTVCMLCGQRKCKLNLEADPSHRQCTEVWSDDEIKVNNVHICHVYCALQMPLW